MTYAYLDGHQGVRSAVKETGCEGVCVWTKLTLDRVQWQDRVDTDLERWIP
jgi:hypothetical protein